MLTCFGAPYFGDKALEDVDDLVGGARAPDAHGEGLVGHDLLEAGVLVLELLQTLGALGLHPAVLGAPAVPRRLRDLEGPEDFREVLAVVEQPVAFAELADHLLGGVAVSLHGGESSFLARILGHRTPTTAGSLLGASHLLTTGGASLRTLDDASRRSRGPVRRM
jgi:hypothetical protein